jgi:malonate transporter and related proteins
MPFVVSIIAPIFGLIACGYLAARYAILPPGTANALSSFVFVIAVPLLLFRTVATTDFGNGNPLLLWLAYFGALVPVFAIGNITSRLFGSDRREAVIAGVSSGYSNLIFVGLPVIQRAFGPDGVDIFASLVAQDGLVTGVPALSPLETLRRVGKRLIRSALVIGILCGALWRLTGLSLEGPHGDIVNALAGTSGPVALFSLGMSLASFGLRGELPKTVFISALTLLAQPLAVLTFGSLFLPPLWLAVAVMAAACPVGVNSYLFAAHVRSGEKLAAGVIVLSTVGSALTLSFWLSVMT